MEARYPSLRNKEIIVVGTGGIGGAIVRDFLEQGSRVHCIDKNQRTLEGLYVPWKKEWGDTSRLQIYVADVTKREDYRKVIEEIGRNNHPIRSFVYTAGIGQSTPIGEIREELLDYLIDLNVKGFVLGLEYVFPFLTEGSSVTVISSINAYRPEHGMGVYDATKAAIRQYAATAAADLGIEKKVRVNAVAPGYIRTPQTIEELKNPVNKQRIENATVLGRIGEPEDVSSLVVWLASEDARFVTGICIGVTGGLALPQYPPIEKQRQMI